MNPVDVRQEILLLWRELLEADSVSDDDDFVAAGGDSLLTLELIARLEARFPTVRFSEMEDFSWLTPRDLADRVLGRETA